MGQRRDLDAPEESTLYFGMFLVNAVGDTFTISYRPIVNKLIKHIKPQT